MRVGPHNGGRGPFLTSYSSSSLKRWVGGGPSSSSCLHLIRRISSTSFFPLLVSLSSPPHTFSFYSFSPFTYSLPWYAKSTFSFLFSPHSRCPRPPPRSFLFHNGGRCHRPLPNVQRITHGVISMHYFILSAVGRSKKAANTQLNEHRIYHQWLYVLVVFFNSLTWVDRTFIIFGSTRLYFLVCLSISVPVHFFTKHDEISRSRKISWDLATRILTLKILDLVSRNETEGNKISISSRNLKYASRHPLPLYLVICLSCSAVGGARYCTRGEGGGGAARAWDHTNALASGT